MTTPAEIAATTFSQKYNCSQSVFLAFAQTLGLDRETALRLASPFGGGIARQGEVCGAVTGALMALGLARGTVTPADKERIYNLSRDFMQRFEQKHGTILCRNLIDCDISTPAGYQAATEKRVFTLICPLLVQDAAEIVQQLLETA
ncbi:MAG TPA: C-GCAxxG-C-C family protein [Anaerolineales bacterium]|nr:C-GCAxxG-C-C family protein [Anaerolineales bacterium]